MRASFANETFQLRTNAHPFNFPKKVTMGFYFRFNELQTTTVLHCGTLRYISLDTTRYHHLT